MKGHSFGHALFFTFGLAALAPAIAGSLGGTLELADEGNFFVGGQVVRSEYPGVPLVGGSGPGRSRSTDVSLSHPKSVNAPPSSWYMDLPYRRNIRNDTDGREGRGPIFRASFQFVVDHAGRGRPVLIQR
jgi:hypothetical protein